MPTNLPSRARRHGAFPWVALTALFVMCTVPVVALFTIGAVLDRNCQIISRVDGDAGTNMVWRIETQRCGDGPLVSNVLLAPRGKTLALAASSTGAPRPIAVDRTADGVTTLRLEAEPGGKSQAIILPLKATGRPAKPLVLANGQPKR